MGLLVDGQWVDQWYDTSRSGGRFERQAAQFRRRVARDDPQFPPTAGRYHLYVSYACPWAHRTLIGRALKGLEDVIGASAVHPHMLASGWEFAGDHRDPLYGKRFLYEIYQAAAPDYSGRVTVPVLWDKQTETIVSNESSEILRMLDQEFAPDRGPTLYPEPLRDEIDRINARVYDEVNNGVYKAGFATTQAAYDEAVAALFAALDWLEGHLDGKRYLVGEQLTEADVRLFTTLLRFDPVYYVHFKCARRRIADYRNLWAFTRRIYQTPGVKPTVHFDHIREHYFFSHQTINPHRIVPIEPDLSAFDQPVD